jgi:hypothetical protein
LIAPLPYDANNQTPDKDAMSRLPSDGVESAFGVSIECARKVLDEEEMPGGSDPKVESTLPSVMAYPIEGKSKESLVVSWAFEFVAPLLHSYGLSIERARSDIEFDIVDTRLSPTKVIGYIQIIMNETTFRATLRPKGFQYMNGLFASLDSIMHSHLAREMRQRMIYRRIFIHIPYHYLS